MGIEHTFLSMLRPTGSLLQNQCVLILKKASKRPKCRQDRCAQCSWNCTITSIWKFSHWKASPGDQSGLVLIKLLANSPCMRPTVCRWSLVKILTFKETTAPTTTSHQSNYELNLITVATITIHVQTQHHYIRQEFQRHALMNQQQVTGCDDIVVADYIIFIPCTCIAK